MQYKQYGNIKRWNVFQMQAYIVKVRTMPTTSNSGGRPLPTPIGVNIGAN